jgi:hypothetical protein
MLIIGSSDQPVPVTDRNDDSELLQCDSIGALTLTSQGAGRKPQLAVRTSKQRLPPLLGHGCWVRSHSHCSIYGGAFLAALIKKESIKGTVRFSMGLRMEVGGFETELRQGNTPHVVGLHSSPSQKPKVGSLRRLFDAFWKSDNQKKIDDDEKPADVKDLGHYGSILFDFEFQHQQEKDLPMPQVSPTKSTVRNKASEPKLKAEAKPTSVDAAEDDNRWMTLSQRPTTTQPVPIPQPTHHHTHNFERIEAIYI